MAQVSKKPLRKEVYQQIFELLLKVFTESHSREKASLLLDDLLSPTEKIVLAKRLAIALLLTKGYCYEEIKEVLKVSMATIAAVNLNVKYRGKGYRYFAGRILKEQKIRKIWREIEDLVLEMGSAGGKGSQGWRRLKYEVQKKRRQKATPIFD